MHVRYERWRHKALAEHYAVRLEERRVTGIAGPLDGQLPPPAALPHLTYDADPDRCCWLQESESEYLLIS